MLFWHFGQFGVENEHGHKLLIDLGDEFFSLQITTHLVKHVYRTLLHSKAI